MPLPELDKIYLPRPGDIRAQWLEDYELGLKDAGVEDPAVEPGSEPYVRATAMDNMAQAIYANYSLSADGQNELTATGDDLDQIREALGLPIVAASPSSGRVLVRITGSNPVAFLDGLEFVLPNGLRGRVDGTQSSITNGGSVRVQMIDAGFGSNADPGTEIRWVSPPLNVNEVAIVDPDGLTGGVDDESDGRKRDRISQHRKYPPAAGNWPMVAALAEASTAAIQKAFVYPALNGRGSQKVVLTKAMVIDGSSTSYSREVSDTAVAQAQSAIEAELPAPTDTQAQSAVDEPVDVALQLALSTANGWLNAAPWPRLEALDNGRVTVTAVTSSTQITVSAATATAPTAGASAILWWDPTNRRFTQAVISAGIGSAGAWVLTLDTPLAGVAVGDYISAAALNADLYRDTWLGAMNGLGPGENTEDAGLLLRAYRHPAALEEWPSDLSLTQLTTLQTAHSEIRNGAYSYRSLTSPTVPASRDDAPNVLALRHFGIYPL